MTIVNNLDLDALVLAEGAHGDHEAMCIMEAVAFMAGERWSDSPECASPVIGAFLRSWNDALPVDDRQQLKRYIPRLIGSRGTSEQEDARAWMALDWLVRDYTPAWLRLAKLGAHADILAALPEFRAGIDVPSVRPAIEAARKDARDAAWDAAWAAARDAAWAAAWAAAWDAAWDAARDAAWAAAWAAAGDAARDALRSAVATLEESAHRLVERMLAA